MELVGLLGHIFFSISISLCVSGASVTQSIFQGDHEESDWDEVQSILTDSSSYPSEAYSYVSSDDDVLSDGESNPVVSDWPENSSSMSIMDDRTSEGVSKSMNRLSSFIYNTHSFRIDGCLILDQNEDGFITKEEYTLCNPGLHDDIVSTLFDTLDTNGDDKITKAELDKNADFWETTEDCEVFAIQHCDDRLIYAVEVSEDESDQEAMCQGLQSYLKCLSSESSFCDFTGDFLQAVYTFADSYIKTNVCEHLVVGQLARFGNSNLSSRRKRSISMATASPSGDNQLECTTPQMAKCSSIFKRSLMEAGDFCSALGEYRHCVGHAAKSCHDEILLQLKESVRILAHVYKKLQICDYH